MRVRVPLVASGMDTLKANEGMQVEPRIRQP